MKRDVSSQAWTETCKISPHYYYTYGSDGRKNTFTDIEKILKSSNIMQLSHFFFTRSILDIICKKNSVLTTQVSISIEVLTVLSKMCFVLSF